MTQQEEDGRVVAIRHPPVAVAGTCYGRANVLLADPRAAPGQLLAAMGPRGSHFDSVWSSPLTRCSEPAKEIAAQLGAALRIDDRLFEISLGRWEGCRWSDIESEEPSLFTRWMANWLTEPAPEGETIAVFEARVATWLRAVEPGGSHLLIAHAGVMRALQVIAGVSSWREAMEAPLPPLASACFRLPVRP